MSEHVKLEANDGHALDAYVAHPEGVPIAPNHQDPSWRPIPAASPNPTGT